MKIGLALGGGGARGFYHLGVLRALERMRIKPQVIAGSSIGAIIGGLYSLHCDIHKVEKILFDQLAKYQKPLSLLKSYAAAGASNNEKMFFDRAFSFIKDLYVWNVGIMKPSMVDSKPFFILMHDLFGKHQFSDCKIPFITTTVDLLTGESVCLTKGSMATAIMASSSVPGVFSAVKCEDKMLVDGGSLLSMPGQIIKDPDTFVIGVNVELPWVKPNPRNALDTFFLVDRIRYNKICQENLKYADFLINPDLTGIAWVDFDKVRMLVHKGETETMAKAKDLRQAIELATPKTSVFTGVWRNFVKMFSSK